MKRLVLILTVACALATVLLFTAGPAPAHCVQTPAGYADLAPGHFAAAGGHESAIQHSGGVVGPPCSGTELNPTAPDNNPG